MDSHSVFILYVIVKVERQFPGEVQTQWEVGMGVISH